MLNSSLLQGMVDSQRLSEKKPLCFQSVCTDTRKVAEGDLFVPLIGERFNGHEFIDDAIKGGAAAALWQKEFPLPEHLPSSFQLYFVKDTLHTLQQMARAYREQINPTVIGITGSNGKTTTKDILASILSLHGVTYKTQGNYNNHIGLPLTILGMPSTCNYLILEMGMSGFGEIEFLSRLSSPDEAIVTNIGESHMEQLGSREGIAKAKMEIQKGLRPGGFVILDGDEPLLEPYLNECSHSVGFTNSCKAVISNVKGRKHGYEFTYASSQTFELPLLGKHNIKNAGYCIALAKKLGISDEMISKGLHNVSLTGMRLERQVGKKGELIINDAYNASPTSMVAAIETLKSLHGYTNYIAVLGDMYELGSDEERLHRQVAEAIDEPITHLVAVGEKAEWIADECEKNRKAEMVIFTTTSKEEAARFLQETIDTHSVVLFKASRGKKLEEIIDLYQINRKGNES